MSKSYSIRDNCRLCLREKLTPRLFLTPTPPANELAKTCDLLSPVEEFPLYLVSCDYCGHVQLPVVISPERLFNDYVYVSGTSPVFVKHFEDYADDLINKYSLQENDLVVEIGSNDGTLLRFFQNFGARVIGIDPAVKIAEKANESGINTICDFFNHELVEKIIDANGRAKIVVANNVFAHADDIRSIVLGVKNLLELGGHFVFEVSYLVDVLEKTLFDTIYHEHLAYHHIDPLCRLFDEFGMCLYDAKRVDTHGGSIRCYVVNSRANETRNLNSFINHESILGLKTDFIGSSINFSKIDPFRILESRIETLRSELKSYLYDSFKSGRSISGFGYPAKATTLLYHFGLGRREFQYIIDDSTWKQGLYSPGKGIEIVSSEYAEKFRTDDVVILAWNFADSIIKKNMSFLDRKGRIVVPLPELLIHG
jgi:SAM-dependent methyltransferase